MAMEKAAFATRHKGKEEMIRWGLWSNICDKLNRPCWVIRGREMELSVRSEDVEWVAWYWWVGLSDLPQQFHGVQISSRRQTHLQEWLTLYFLLHTLHSLLLWDNLNDWATPCCQLKSACLCTDNEVLPWRQHMTSAHDEVPLCQ